MASRADVSFYKDLLHKPVVDCDGQPIGALLDLSAGPIGHSQPHPCVKSLLVRPRRPQRYGFVASQGHPLVLPWELVASLESRCIQLRIASRDLGPVPLAADEILLYEHIMDQQIVDRHGLKLRRVNDIAMALSDGSLCLWGMDTGVRGLLTRLGFRWGLLALFRPLFARLHNRVIEWECVDRVEPARGWIRLRVTREDVRSTAQKKPHTPET